MGVGFDDSHVGLRVMTHPTTGVDRMSRYSVVLVGFSEDHKMMRLLYEDGTETWEKTERWVIDSPRKGEDKCKG